MAFGKLPHIQKQLNINQLKTIYNDYIWDGNRIRNEEILRRTGIKDVIGKIAELK